MKKWDYLMHKLPKIITILIFSVFLFAEPVFAVSDSLIISCPSSVNTSATFECRITGTSGSGINKIQASISATNLQIVSFASDTAWNGGLSGTALSLSSTSELNGSFSLGTITFRANASGGSGNVVMDSIVFSSKDSESSAAGMEQKIAIIASETPIIQNTTEEDNQNITSNNTTAENSTSNTSSNESVVDTTLYSLDIEGYEIDFSPTTYTYTIKLKEGDTSLNIVASPKDSSAKVKITGNEDLADGSAVRISVSKGENLSTYRIKISSSDTPAIINTTNSTKKEKTTFNPMIILIIVGGVLIIGGIVAFILIKKKKSSDPYANSTGTSNVGPSPFPTDSALQNAANPFVNNENTPVENPLTTPNLPEAPNPFLSNTNIQSEQSSPASSMPFSMDSSINSSVPNQSISTAFEFQAPPSLPTAPVFADSEPKASNSVPESQETSAQSMPPQTNFQTAMPAPEINPQGSPISVKDMPFESASSESPAIFES